MKDFLKTLNDKQKSAVLNVEGPSLVVAGAGSGKTKVLTTRLAYIIDQKKAWANQILCVTFTNKAAKEMRERVIKILGPNASSLSWLGTFHSISVKFLRRHAEAIGLKRLMARPVAKYTITAQEKHEKNEKVHAED